MIEKLLRGDEAAIEQINNYVKKVCRSILKGDCEDAAQEAMVRIWASLDKFKGNSSLLTWVNQIAANECYRQLNKRQMESIEMDLHDHSSTDLDPMVEDLREAMKSLEPRQRESIQGKLEGKTSSEIASEMGITTNHLWQIQFTARQKLKEVLS